jgi:hypothetical protein
VPIQGDDGSGDSRRERSPRFGRVEFGVGQKLGVRQIDHEGGDPRASSLHGRVDALGKRGARRDAAGSALANMRAMFGDGALNSAITNACAATNAISSSRDTSIGGSRIWRVL